MSRRRTRHARRGYVLVMVAMLAFAFFALAALVIDMGMVRLTQRQMQSATDSAALEGLRFRDGIPSVLWPPGVDLSENPTLFQAMVFAQLGSYPTPQPLRVAIKFAAWPPAKWFRTFSMTI